MRKPAIIAITGILITAASLIIMAVGFQTGIYPVIHQTNPFLALFPFLFMLVGFVLVFVGCGYNYWEYKKGRVGSFWTKNWEGA